LSERFDLIISNNVIVPCALIEHRAMKAYWVNGGIAPRILDLGIRWRRVV